MNHESNEHLGKWQDTRELLRRAGRIYVEPVAYDIFARIVPGLLLMLGVFAVTKGFALTWELATIPWNWALLLAVLFFAWLLGMALIVVARSVWYAKPVQPAGWRKFLWLEAIEDFENRAPLALRRKAGRARILSDGSIAAGAALGVVLLVAIVTQNTPAAWSVLLLFIAMSVFFAIHVKLGARWALGLAVVFGILLLVAVSLLDLAWMGPVLFLLVAIVALRVVHKVFRKQWHEAVLRVVSQETVMTALKAKPGYLGPQGSGADDGPSSKSRFEDVRDALFENPYYSVWGIGGQQLPVYRVTLESVLRGILPYGLPYLFRAAAARTVDSRSALRPGPDGRGYRRLLHPNGICLFGTWEITEESGFTGYFRSGKKALLIARYSTCCTETRRGRKRSLSMVGKLYPTDDPNEEVPTANFITQQDLGGDRNQYINEAEFLNTPDATVWRRGLGLDGVPVILLTGLVFKIVDREPANRQLYEIAELGEEGDTKSPEFMRLVVDENQTKIPGDDLDFRDEVLAQIYDPGVHHDKAKGRQLIFHIEVSDTGKTIGPAFFQRRKIEKWQRIGRLVFDEAVASYNGDFVVHFHHPGWREKRDDPTTAVRSAAREAPV